MSSAVSWNTHRGVAEGTHPEEQHKQESTLRMRDSLCAAGRTSHALDVSRATPPRRGERHPNTQRHTRTTRSHKSKRALRFVLLEEGDWTLKQACFQGYPESAVCVQESVGSRNSAIHNAYRSSLHPSSLFEPRHRSLKVVR